MFSSVQRIQQTTNHAMSVVFLITALVYIGGIVQLYLQDYKSVTTQLAPPVTKHALKKTRQFGSLNGEVKENIKFTSAGLTTDLSPLFTYNTKQVFVYLTYEYPGYNELSSSKITFWDKIIHSEDEAVIELSQIAGKYSCWDASSGTNFTSLDGELKLEYNIQPYVGLLHWGETKGAIPVSL